MTTMQQLLEAGRKFRQVSPVVGSVEMIHLLTEMVKVYDELSEVTLPANEAQRNTLVRALFGMRHIKRMFYEKDWEALGRNTLLYEFNGFA